MTTINTKSLLEKFEELQADGERVLESEGAEVGEVFSREAYRELNAVILIGIHEQLTRIATSLSGIQSEIRNK